MKVLATGMAALLAIGTANLAFGAACPPFGGDDQTSENFSAAGGNWVTGLPTPGTVAGGLVSNDLLITEYAYTGNSQEFVEIYNPTATPITLDEYYLSDDAFTGPIGYWRIVLGGGYSIGTSADFNVKFPAGTVIMPGQALVIYMGCATTGSAGVPPYQPIPFGFGTPDFEICDNSPAVPNMVAIGNIPGGTVAPGSGWNGLMTNGSTTNGEMAMLYRWDGVCDLVCDVDYVGWGAIAVPTVSHRIDKTGISIDGIDADASPSTYLPDTAIASQSPGQTHATGSTVQRVAVGFHAANGNGCLQIVVPTLPSTWSNIKSLYN